MRCSVCHGRFERKYPGQKHCTPKCALKDKRSGWYRTGARHDYAAVLACDKCILYWDRLLNIRARHCCKEHWQATRRILWVRRKMAKRKAAELAGSMA